MTLPLRPARLRRSLRLMLVTAWLVSAGSPAVAQRDTNLVEWQQAASLSRKIAAMARYAEAPGAVAHRTPITESELNAFLRLVAADGFPVGVTEPSIRLRGGGDVEASAVVDLDAVHRAAQGDWTDLRQRLTGRVPVTVRGQLRAVNGWARVDLSGAEVSGIPVPMALLQEIVTYYSRSPEFPSGVDLDAPFQLPARIREIRVHPREAVVLQH